MKIVETLNEGLKRAYTLTLTAKDIEARVDAELKAIAPTMRLPGFRPGKVPANLVRKMHGPALLQEALSKTVQAGVQKLLEDHKLRPAIQPAVELAEGFESGKDASIAVSMEVLPDIAAPNVDGIQLERLTVPADDAAIDEQLAKLAEGAKNFEAAPKSKKAESGDQVLLDFVGKVDGVAFEGGTGEGMAVEIGAGQLIPGFEDQLIGVKANDEKQLNVTFPDEYPVETLKGKPATFDVVISEVRVRQETKVDEDFAKSLGLEGLEQLRGLLKGQVEQEHNGLTRTHMKRQLLDTLAGDHDFEVPPTMVEAEFGQIWQQLEQEAAREPDPEAARAEMEADRAEYHSIAARRVRLGLLLSEIGRANNVDVTAAEMNRLIAQAAQQYSPEERDRFVEYVRNDPMAAAQLRAPLYEEKVVDFIFGKAVITDRDVTKAELEAAIEAETSQAASAKPAKPAKKAAKSETVKSTKADAGKAESAAEKTAPAAKAAAKKADVDKAEAPAKAAAKKAAPKKSAK
jgi:trigger factor